MEPATIHTRNGFFERFADGVVHVVTRPDTNILVLTKDEWEQVIFELDTLNEIAPHK